MCLAYYDIDVWPLIFALNGLRNDLALQLDLPKFEAKLKRGRGSLAVR